MEDFSLYLITARGGLGMFVLEIRHNQLVLSFMGQISGLKNVPHKVWLSDTVIGGHGEWWGFPKDMVESQR